MSLANLPDRLTVQQLAEFWQVSEKTVRDLVKRGELKSVMVGGRYRFTREDVQRFEEANRYRYQDLSSNPYGPAA